jgi:flagellar basal-body rod protein FlgG
MTDTIAAIANAMQSDAEALRVISQNVANAQTPAYRREVALARASFDDLTDSLRIDSSVDVRPGTLQSTGEPLHFAIEGKGFFVVSGAQGERLTRRGDFRLDASGQLVTATGDAVLGANGPIQLAGQPRVASDGTVRVNDTLIDRLRVVEVNDGAQLRPAGDDTYELADGGDPPADGSASQVRQGYLETSNVQSVNEMITLMETMRRFEAAQRFVRGYDEMVGKALDTLGKV